MSRIAGNELTSPLTLQVSPLGVGTTTPPVGTTNEVVGSVIPLTATGNSGFSFAGWTGDVTDPMNSSTTIIIGLNPETVTANFTAECSCAQDVSGLVTVTLGPYVLKAKTGRYAQTVMVMNTSTATITGPISLVLDGLSTDATLFNLTGATDALELPAGSPYRNVAGNLAAGESASFALKFTDPSQRNITYSTRVLAGPGAR